VGAEGGDQDGVAVSIVARVLNMLYAWSEKDAAPGVDSVVGLDDIFAAVIQFAVAEEEAQAAIGEVNLVIP
jgi:hypothetical protein